MTELALPSAQEPLSAQILKFIDAYVGCLDLEKAATSVGLPEEMGKALYRRARIRGEIDKRLEAVQSEVTLQMARKRIVTVENLDRNLHRIVNLSKKDILAAPALAASKVKAIELGYQRTGILIDGNFIPDAGSDASKPEAAPRIFRGSMDRHIITHTEIRETVTAEQATPAPRSTPRTIDAQTDEDPWKNF